MIRKFLHYPSKNDDNLGLKSSVFTGLHLGEAIVQHSPVQRPAATGRFIPHEVQVLPLFRGPVSQRGPFFWGPGAVKGTGNPWKLWKIIIFLLEESGKSRFFDGNLTILMHFEWDLFRIFAGKLNKFSWENHKSELEHHPYFERKSQCFEHARTPFDNAHYNVPFGQPWSKVSRPGCNANATKPVTHVCLLPGLRKKCS